MPPFRNHTTLLAVLAVSSLPTRGSTQDAVSPSDRTNLEGSSFTHYPLGRANARIQQLHGDLPAGMVLHGHAYRRDAAQVRGTVEAFAADLQVSLSMSPNSPAQASPTFAGNVGASAVVVLPRTTLGFPPTTRPTLDPSPTFDLVIPYLVPFVVPAGGGTICLDLEMYGNTSAAGANRNLSIYLDAHTLYANGRNEQEGFRLGSGCPAPGQTAASYATLTLWHLGSAMQFDTSLRLGVPDNGSGSTRAWLALGHGTQAFAWPGRPGCTLLSSTEVWFTLPGNLDGAGSYDGALGGMPVLPAGHRLWCQAGSVDTIGGALAFGDLSCLTTPPMAPATLPAARVANGSDRTATTGSVSLSVPVTRFF